LMMAERVEACRLQGVVVMVKEVSSDELGRVS
jgi:hypothetical protein